MVVYVLCAPREYPREKEKKKKFSQPQRKDTKKSMPKK